MDIRQVTGLFVVTVCLSGCATSSCSKKCEKDDSINIGPLIGLIGMAVDGDDKDDYEHFFHDDKCKCCN